MKAGYVALIGRPNVGKSTLLNSLLGEKVAIISNKPQTTRVSILGVKTTPAGQIIFIDNPGIHKPLHTLNRRMMNFVYSALETADLVCLLIDATERFGHGDEFVVETLRKVTTPLFLLINKVDIIKKEKILLIIDQYKDRLPFKEIIPISALKRTNLNILEEQIYVVLPEAEKLYADDMVTDRTLRFQLAEIIREKLLERVEEELPFVTAVLIDSMEERKDIGSREKEEEEKSPETKILSVDENRPVLNSLSPNQRQKPGKPKEKKQRTKVTYISASIFVERDSHRGIVIGRQGRLIKEIGIEARREIERILDSRVYLELKVKVRKKWRDSPDVLDLIEGQR
ncbi:MAG: GTPase Era [Candidatus Aminicenantes bacterium]|nr:GTPase Era [Candidatus Aminicenantes bacterium]